ncbi:hypothetical protein DJFAAGMI_01177 [Comamonas sp. PE63]|uniref:GlsB/YeaQ/YmgE family stress response membrane protein n=1 Tax=Comamonas brasiliensis TaxID=1812482 RepID=A0ABS5LPL9_9BURK|nr:GlsB/YeaQ/YmgE family stress response membrane protein [Comamonas sp. PE63]MBS3018445.1 hypothetical protein [Comamonas sp. PE63]
MDFLIWVLVGGLIGWIAAFAMNTRGDQDLIVNIGIGVLGALVGGWLVTPLFGTPFPIDDHEYKPMSIFISLTGALIFLTIFNLVFRNFPPR